MLLKKVILAAEWKVDWKLEGQGRRGYRQTSQQAVVTVVPEGEDDGSCDLSCSSGCRKKVSQLSDLELTGFTNEMAKGGSRECRQE